MTPEAIAALLGLTVPQIGVSAVAAKVLSVLGHIAVDWNSFQQLWASLPNKPLEVPVNIAYRLTQFWTRPGMYIAMLAESAGVPRQFMQPTERIVQRDVGEMDYRYDVQITLHFPNGDVRDFWVHWDSNTPLSLAEARTNAFEQLIYQFQTGRAGSPLHDDPYDYYAPSFGDVHVLRHLGTT